MPMLTIEKRNAEFQFYESERLAHRWLEDAELSGRLGNRTAGHQGVEDLKLANVHGRPTLPLNAHPRCGPVTE